MNALFLQLRNFWKENYDSSGDAAIATLYQEVSATLDREAQWLQEAVPELRPKLLPALIIDVSWPKTKTKISWIGSTSETASYTEDGTWGLFLHSCRCSQV